MHTNHRRAVPARQEYPYTDAARRRVERRQRKVADRRMTRRLLAEAEEEMQLIDADARSEWRSERIREFRRLLDANRRAAWRLARETVAAEDPRDIARVEMFDFWDIADAHELHQAA